jgi:aminodeoxyfutalosine deaminase
VKLFTARFLLPQPDRWFPGGGVLVSRGRIVRVLCGPAAVARARRDRRVEFEDLGDVVVTAGLVDAHAHLELGGFHRCLPGEGGFARWVGAMVERRRVTGAREYESGVAGGARRLLAGGTTTVGDIDATDALGVADPSLLRVRRYRELIDAGDGARTPSALRRVSRALRSTRSRFEGLSPHAPFTASRELLAAARRIASRRRVPLQVHWSESEEEISWLLHGTGPFAAFLPLSPRRSGLDLLEEAGLLGEGMALVHGNLPARGEIARIAAAGATVVHCPGTHAFFGREPFPWRRYLEGGVSLALGTDSLASNDDLDLRREMRLAREATPALDPAHLWSMGTTAAARALALSERVGDLREGLEADLVAWEGLGAVSLDTALDALTSGVGHPLGRWVGGRRVSGNGDPTGP